MSMYKCSVVVKDDQIKQEIIEEIKTHLSQNIEILDLSALLCESGDDEIKKICFCSGGDGTLNYVMSEIVNSRALSEVEVCYLPSGTGNDFARETGLLNTDINLLFNEINKNKPSEVNIGKINDRYFINMATCGEFAKITGQADGQFKEALGRLSYLITAVKKMTNLETQNYKYVVDNKREENSDLFGFFVGNSRMCGGGILTTNSASLKDGKLDLLLIGQMPLGDLAKLGLDIQLGEDVNKIEANAKSYKVKNFKIKSSNDIDMSLDGESYSCREAEFSILEEPLKIYLPEYE